MKLPKFLSLIVFITLFSLLYVYQQTEIFLLAYDGQKKQSILQDLLDKNTILRYNIARNVSLTRIGNKISNNVDFQMPDAYRLVKLSQPLDSLDVSQYVPKKESMIARIFGIKTQAEAKMISPSATFKDKRSKRLY
ncbi:MAG: hypothetical protein ABIH18_02155 [Candidatus Omnitrophota bacterium]